MINFSFFGYQPIFKDRNRYYTILDFRSVHSGIDAGIIHSNIADYCTSFSTTGYCIAGCCISFGTIADPGILNFNIDLESLNTSFINCFIGCLSFQWHIY